MTLILSNADAEKLITMPECIDVLEEAYVELAEGPKMMTNIVDIDLKDVKIGMDVKLKFIQTEGDGPPMPFFAPA